MDTETKNINIEMRIKTHENIKKLAALQDTTIKDIYNKAAYDYLKENKELLNKIGVDL